MNKDEILEKSRKENQFGDERIKSIAKTANENAYTAIMFVFALLSIAALIQKFTTGSPFADPHIFSLAFFTGLAGKNITKYSYHKKTEFLILSIAAIIGALACFLLIIL